jgi:hypothetical protein
MVVEDFHPDGVMGTSGDHKLKKGIARVSDIARCYRSHLDELVSGADLPAIPAVIEVYLLKFLW